jgi:dipeptidyl aminopeptidase/acylaminoacyl peptidase
VTEMTNDIIRRQFGLWDSSITPISLARGKRYSGLDCDKDGTLVWLEGRSDRGVLVVQPANAQASRDLNSEYSVRAKIGYAGGDFSVSQGWVYFIDGSSGRIYRQKVEAGLPAPITPAFGNAASPALSPDGRWLVYVHSDEGQDCLAIVDAAGQGWPQKLVGGDDFYMQPVWHPDGQQIAWIAWNHPNMPWDGTVLRLGSLQPGGSLPEIEEVITIAGGDEISVFQPEFSPDGRYLAYAADPDGWWQLFLYDLSTGEHRQLTRAQVEHAVPAWIQGLRTYAFSRDSSKLYFIRSSEGFMSLWWLDLSTGDEKSLPLSPDYTYFEQICPTPDGVAVVASGGKTPARIITIKVPSASVQVCGRATTEEIPASTYSAPQPIHWPGMDGETVYGLFYDAHSESFHGTGSPPLIVHVHGGPTSQGTSAFNPQLQFFTSRGFAVLEVNYRGSTGYGRDYRNMLRGSWGIYDVQDSVSGARYLGEQGKVDGSRLVVMGGSAGGFTVLKAMEDFPGFFKAGICLYGVSNQFTLAAETHKFEARYSDSLLGPLPEAAAIYRDRSPIFFADKIIDPIAIFQGEVDVVVPRSQSDEVVENLQRRGVPYIYHVYPGEGHGFRKAETIEHFYQAVERFLRQYVIFS